MLASDLFDVFGGQDNLRLMCEAEGFYENAERGFIRFTLGGGRHVWLCSGYAEYVIYLYDKETGTMVLDGKIGSKREVQELFERYSGYSLSFNPPPASCPPPPGLSVFGTARCAGGR
jgi:hypothetical protein